MKKKLAIMLTLTLLLVPVTALAGDGSDEPGMGTKSIEFVE